MNKSGAIHNTNKKNRKMRNHDTGDNFSIGPTDRLELTCKTLRISELADMQKGLNTPNSNGMGDDL